MLLEWMVLTVKSVALVAVPPPEVVTRIRPVVAPVGTVAVICVAETTVKVVAFTLLKLTAVTPVNPVPVMVTEVPTGPDVGVKDVIVTHDEATVKLVKLDPVPPGAVTLIGPVVAPVGTVAVICVAEFTVKVVAFTLLKLTAVAPVKLVPVSVTTVATGPHVGENDVTVGQVLLATVKLVALSAVPEALVTWMGPVVVPVFTTAVIEVLESILKEAAAVVLKTTAVTLGLSKFVPVIVTTHPTGPLAGANELIVGTAANAGASSPSTSKAAATPIPAARRPMCRFNRVMTPPSLSASTSSRLWLHR
jgi:hypothetical protein